MSRTASFVFIAALLGSGLAYAETPASPEAKGAPAVKTADPLDQMVCKKSKQPGSNVRMTSVCRTKRQWNKQAEETSRGFTQRLNESGRIGSVCPGGGAGC